MGNSCLKIISLNFLSYKEGGICILQNVEKTVLDYQKARGMTLAACYASSYFPFTKTLRIVRDECEWAKVESQYGENLVYRLDFLNGSRQNMTVNTTGAKKDVLPLLEKLKRNREAALLLLELTEEFVPRYAYDGGFSVLFLAYQEVIIEINGRGFDGRGLTSGRAMCDRFRIPWEMLEKVRDMDMEEILCLRTEHVTPKKYAELRRQRIEELVSKDWSREFLGAAIPKEYEMPKEAVLNLIKNVVPCLAGKHQKITAEIGRDAYAAQGNLVQGKAQVWEIFDENRWRKGANFSVKKVALKLGYEEEISKLNDEIVAALYYLKVPYEYWWLLTLWGEEKRKLELQDFSYDYEGYKRIKSLRDLLIEQRKIVTDCWELADERLAKRACRINDCIIGRETQALALKSGMLDDKWRTDALKLRTIYTFILREEKKLFGEGSNDAELENKLIN